jgi:hypothetical protein
MTMSMTNYPIYEALVIPTDALDKGGLEILRAGIVADELYVTARRAFKNPAQWGDVLADITRHLALLYAAEDTDLSEAEIRTDIMEAFVADLGARKVAAKGKSAARPGKKKAKARSATKRRAVPKKSPKRKSAKRSRR